jgi:hypothetical protein
MGGWQTRRGTILSGFCILAIAITTSLSAQDSQKSQMSLQELVRATVANEVAAANNRAVKFMFCSRKQTSKGVQDRVYAEANEAVASMAINGSDHPLSPQQQQAETDKLSQLANSPAELRRKQEHGYQELEHTLRIVKALPDAFSYEYVRTENGEPGLGKTGNQLVRLHFKPNPSYAPPSTVEQVLQGMEGDVLIDPSAHRLARIDGALFKEVAFGWGIFGRLDKGGSFRVQQADAGDGNWVVTEMNLRMTGKILLVKSLNLSSDEVFSNFQRLPDDLPFARAVEMLKTEQEKLAQNINAFRSVRINQASR